MTESRQPNNKALYAALIAPPTHEPLYKKSIPPTTSAPTPASIISNLCHNLTLVSEELELYTPWYSLYRNAQNLRALSLSLIKLRIIMAEQAYRSYLVRDSIIFQGNEWKEEKEKLSVGWKSALKRRREIEKGLAFFGEFIGVGEDIQREVEAERVRTEESAKVKVELLREYKAAGEDMWVKLSEVFVLIF